MSEATATAVSIEAAETLAAPDADVVAESPETEKSNLPIRIEWDEAEAAKETADAGTKLLNTVVPLYNKLVGIVEKYTAATDIDSAVEAGIASSTDEEVVTLRTQIEKAQKLIEANTAKINEKVRASLMADIDPEFDEAKVKAAYNDTRSELKKNGTSVRDVFKLLQFVTSELSPAGRESNFKGLNAQGELLLKVLDVPKLEGATASTGTSDAVKEFNRAAKEWARNTGGFKVADKGALSTEVKEAYSKATGTPIP